MLKQSLRQIRESLSGASVIYVDIFTVLLELFQHPTSHGSNTNPYTCLRVPEFLHYFSDFYLLFETGLKYGTKACCGYGGGDYNFDPKVYCGNSKVIKGRKVTATACNDPYNYVSWDGVHATEAANKLTTFAILNGSYSDPPFPFQDHCDLQPIH